MPHNPFIYLSGDFMKTYDMSAEVFDAVTGEHLVVTASVTANHWEGACAIMREETERTYRNEHAGDCMPHAPEVHIYRLGNAA